MRTITYEEKKRAIASFNLAVDGAMSRTAPTKSWVRAAVRRNGAGRCPVRLRRLSFDIILKYREELEDLFVEYPDDILVVPAYEATIGYQPEGSRNRIDPIRVLTEGSEWTDEWGTSWRHAEDGVGATPSSNPLGDWSLVQDYLGTMMPDANLPDRLREAVPSVRTHGSSRYLVGITHLAIFERYHCLRGMENALMDFLLNPVEAEGLLEVLTEYLLGIVRAWGRLGSVDCFFLTDDWGTQETLMISPALWRKFFAGRYRRICDEAHRLGMEVYFHSCGNVTGIIGDLIDLGVDIIDPLQPEAMDLDFIAREFGGKIAFAGGISDQALAGYTPGRVRD
jgi:uroporphyrinogen decarboxylase